MFFALQNLLLATQKTWVTSRFAEITWCVFLTTFGLVVSSNAT
jgi:hypothetical protein